jgi:hypothetical protein
MRYWHQTGCARGEVCPPKALPSRIITAMNNLWLQSQLRRPCDNRCEFAPKLAVLVYVQLVRLQAYGLLIVVGLRSDLTSAIHGGHTDSALWVGQLSRRAPVRPAPAAKVRKPPFDAKCVLCSIQKNGFEPDFRCVDCDGQIWELRKSVMSKYLRSNPVGFR